MKALKTLVALFLALFLTSLRPELGGADETKVMNFIAVMDLKCGAEIPAEACKALTDIVLDELVAIGSYTVIDRANRDKILSEQGFQQTGCVDESCSVEAGRLLGVGKLVVGSISKVGQTFIINLQLINVATGAVERSANIECGRRVEDLVKCSRTAAKKLMGAPLNENTPATPPPKPPDPKFGEAVFVPAGEFTMGCEEKSPSEMFCDPDNVPAREVYLDAYFIDKFEVTVAQFKACVKAGKCEKPIKGVECDFWIKGRETHPMNCVNWSQARDYCAFANRRLPTEAEWEKAARGTDGRRYPWGDEPPSCSLAVFALPQEGGQGCGKGTTWPVGSKPSGASPYGAMDMLGNVYEWVADWHSDDSYRSDSNRNPVGPYSGDSRSLRGGAWPYGYDSLGATKRRRLPPDAADADLGFRCAVSP